MTVAFFGSSENSLTVIQAIQVAGFSIKLVITAPASPVGRKHIITKTPVQILAEAFNIPVKTPATLKDQTLKILDLTQFDVIIVADYAQLIPPEILNCPKHGCLNLHPSLLPKYRGASPAELAIINGEKETGMSIIKMDEQFDHGPIISQFKEPIRDDDTSETLYNRLFLKGAEVLVTILPAWVEGRITPHPQDHSKATYAPRLRRDDGFIPWDTIQSALCGEIVPLEKLPELFKKVVLSQKRKNLLLTPYSLLLTHAIRALSPWPGVWTKVKVKSQKLKVKSEEKRMKILSSHLENDHLILDQVQIEGKNPSSWNQIQNLLKN